MKKYLFPTLAGALLLATTFNAAAGGAEAVGVDNATLLSPSEHHSAPSSDWMPMLQKGTQELSIGGQLRLKDFDDIDYDLRVKYGWFIKDKWEIGVTGDFVDFGGGRRIGLGGFTEYNFDLGSRFVPYLGASAKWADASFDNLERDSVLFTGELGVKYFLRSHMAIYAAINFEWSPEDIFSVGDDIADNAQNIILGMRFYF